MFYDILTGINREEWNQVFYTLSTFSFTHKFDKLSWRWNSKGQFSVRLAYAFLNYSGRLVEHPFLVWHLPLPPKIKIFLWLVFRNRILTKVNLSRKGWGGTTTCMFCDQHETTNHLFLRCRMVTQIWYWLGKNGLYFRHWRTMKQVIQFAVLLSPSERQTFCIVFSATVWTLWKHRNKI